MQRGLDNVGATGATVTWTLANHDVHRAVTRYGRDQDLVVIDPDDPVGGTRAAASAIDLAQGSRIAARPRSSRLALPGSVYLYQGEELGLPEVLDLPDAARQDPIFARSGGAEPGRDGCAGAAARGSPTRPRSASRRIGGTADAGGPWLPQPDWFAGYAVDAERADPDSTYNLTGGRWPCAARCGPSPASRCAGWRRRGATTCSRSHAATRSAPACAAGPVRAAAGVGRGRAGQCASHRSPAARRRGRVAAQRRPAARLTHRARRH